MKGETVRLSKSKLVKLLGKEKYFKLTGKEADQVKLSRKMRLRIEKELSEHRQVTVELSTNSSSVRVINRKYVTINPRWKFEKEVKDKK